MKNKNLTFSVHKFDLKEESDKSFLRAKFWAIAEGLCRNNVDFTLDSIAKSMPTVRNKPVLGAFDKTLNEFKGHDDLGIKKDEDGNYFVDYDTGLLDDVVERPIGVIPSESNVQIEEYEGNNWLTFDVLIWSKYAHRAVKLLEELGRERISVEITITKGSEDENGTLTVNEFIFDGVTVIGVPEGIEGAHLKVGQFAKSDEFTRYKQALAFAYEEEKNNKEGKKNEVMKFDFKNMGLNTFRDKLWNAIYKYRYNSDDREYYSYWVYDIFPDDNYVIIQDDENSRLFKVPFVINDERDVVLDFEKKELVEIEYVEKTFGRKVEFAQRPVEVKDTIVVANNKENIGKEGSKMDLKFLQKFVEKNYTPICKLDKFVLFTKQDEEDKVYKLEFESIDKCEEENFDEMIAQMSLVELNENKMEDFVARTELELLKTEFEAEKETLSADKVALEKDLEEKKEICTKLEAELSEVKEKYSKFEFERFTIEAKQFIEEIGDEFNDAKDKFISESFEKIEKGEFKDMDAIKQFVAGQLLERTLKEKQIKKAEFGLKPKENTMIEDKTSIGSALKRI